MRHFARNIIILVALCFHSVGRAESTFSMSVPPVTIGSVDLKGDRPSCRKLAWRFVTALSRIDESVSLRKRVPIRGESLYGFLATAGRVSEDSIEGNDQWVVQQVEFSMPGVTAENLKILELDSPSVTWKYSSGNPTDFLQVQFAADTIKVSLAMSYLDYCFSPKSSRMQVEHNGEQITLEWEAGGYDLSPYLDLLR